MVRLVPQRQNIWEQEPTTYFHTLPTLEKLECLSLPFPQELCQGMQVDVCHQLVSTHHSQSISLDPGVLHFSLGLWSR